VSLSHTKTSKKPGTIPVLRSLPGCGKNILVDFLGKNVFGPELFYATSDLGNILGRFNSCIQGRKIIAMNETGMFGINTTIAYYFCT